MTEIQEEEAFESIAVIGMAGCFPGARNLNEYWDNLCRGVESISVFTNEEHETPIWAPQETPWIKAKGILYDTELFDAGFFGYTPEEAKAMDPQHRLFLERGWEAIEQAGYDTERYEGSIGVFAGVSTNTYVLAGMRTQGRGGPAMFTDKDFLATRLSYKLNLTGPSVVVQSACSTSLVAVCMAAQSLLNYQCDMALAGGASVWVPIKSGYPYQPGWPMSPDGHTRAFDAQGRGFVPGSGVGAVFLKRLSEALADGDNIWAVIKGFAVNNDGSAKIGYTAPGVRGQAEVIAMAQQLAGIDPETVTYVEAHGTGTELGDPIEISALTEAFRASTDRNGFCAIGSVKTNIGHLDAAAGIASLQKTILALKHAKLPPSLHFDHPNPKIDFASTPFYVNSELRDWAPEGPRRAGVNSFGIGGTNAHVVLEEAPKPAPAEPARPYQVLTLSARSAEALIDTALNLATHLESTEPNLADVAFTLQTGRRHFFHRRVVVAGNAQEAARELQAVPKPGMAAVAPDGRPEVAFMFPGQGAQYPGMTRELYEQEETFRTEVDRCCALLEPELGLDLRRLIYPDPAGEDGEAASRLTQTSIAQPALFVVEYALARLWMSWGIRPAALIGHSIGEYVAACLADVFSLEDGLRLVTMRAQLMNELPEGAMLALRMSEVEAQAWVAGDVVLAASNAPSLCVLSGPTAQIEDVQRRLEEAKVAAVRLKTSHAFHSSMMDPMLEPFRQFVSGLELREPKIPFVSNLSGTWIESTQARSPRYWADHLRRPVRFAQGIDVLLTGDRVLLEVGPGRTLTTLASSNPACRTAQVVASMGDARAGSPEGALLKKAVGQMWLAGISPDWHALHGARHGRRLPLPTYPFQRQRYWSLDDKADPAGGLASAWGIQKDPGAWYYAQSWKRLPAVAAKPASGNVWLVLADEGGLGARVAAAAAAEGATVAVVVAATGYEELGERSYRIDPLSVDDYGRVLKDLAEQDLVPDRIAHFWGVTNGREDHVDSIRCGRTGFYSLIYLAQALGKAGVSSPIKIAVVTDGAHAVVGDETVAAEKLLIQGPCRVLPQEFRNLSCVHVDLRSSDQRSRSGRQVEELVREIAAEPGEAVVAHRSGRRWAQTFEPVYLDAAEGRTRPLRERGVYLITGGLGGIGQVLGRWLAETVQARLVLTARTALPGRQEWEQWLEEHEDEDPVSRRIRSVIDLEQAGAEVLVLAADVADEAEMRRVVEAAVARFGEVNGAIHAAGVAGGGIVQLKTMEAADRVLRPKVDGLRVLCRVLRPQPLDFIVLCSSMSAVLGGFGQVDYSSANAFMDGVAWENRVSGGPHTISINWNAWREVGMAVETDMPESLRELGNQFSYTDGVLNREGVDAFSRILDRWQEPQVSVSFTDLPQFMKRRWQTAEEVAARTLGPVSIQPRPDLRTPYEEPSTETEKTVSAIWQEVFGYKQIGRDDDFFELGGHSLLAVQLLRPLQDAFDLTLTLPALFENSTIEALARYIDAAVWARVGVASSEDLEAEGREEITL